MKRLLTYVVAMLLGTGIYAATYYASPNGIGDGSSYFSPTTFANGVAMLGSGQGEGREGSDPLRAVFGKTVRCC